MVSKTFKRALLIGTCVYFTYTSHDWIERSIKTMKFFFTRPEEGFVVKDQALDMQIAHELNSQGNLETYVKSYGLMLPVYLRKQGVMVGDATYNFERFNNKERKDLCLEWMVGRGMIKERKTHYTPPKRKKFDFKQRKKFYISYIDS